MDVTAVLVLGPLVLGSLVRFDAGALLAIGDASFAWAGCNRRYVPITSGEDASPFFFQQF